MVLLYEFDCEVVSVYWIVIKIWWFRKVNSWIVLLIDRKKNVY